MLDDLHTSGLSICFTPAAVVDVIVLMSLY